MFGLRCRQSYPFMYRRMLLYSQPAPHHDTAKQPPGWGVKVSVEYWVGCGGGILIVLVVGRRSLVSVISCSRDPRGIRRGSEKSGAPQPWGRQAPHRAPGQTQGNSLIADLLEVRGVHLRFIKGVGFFWVLDSDTSMESVWRWLVGLNDLMACRYCRSYSVI